MCTKFALTAEGEVSPDAARHRRALKANVIFYETVMPFHLHCHSCEENVEARE